ncbi:MAG: hypothetical protein BGP05_20245 [Rhizobiales bacterium 62-47]|nr:hypothetical protein [Hyphomicrobiales bacterium]OJY10062.1 MAG: hypothetical protein BGP05_20245 [Rhizobiales bacterium 62-47]
MPRRKAFLIVLLALTAAVGLALFATSKAAIPAVTRAPGVGDSATYLRIVERMRGGAGYYSAAHQTLLADDYGTASVFNWRTPTWAELLAHLPSIRWAQGLLAGLAMISVLLAYRMLRNDGGPLIAIGTVFALAINFVGLGVEESIVFTEVAAGTLILFSVCAYGNGWRNLGAIAAIVALFIRELVGPYVLICMWLALREKQWKELKLLGVGLAAYFAYFTWHWVMVMHQIGEADRAYSSGWLQFGGLGFVLETAQFNGLLSIVSLGWTALMLPIALLGFVAWPKGLRSGLFVVTYLGLFAIIGKPFNTYWGALYTPVLMLGPAWGLYAIYEGLFSHDHNAGVT